METVLLKVSFRVQIVSVYSEEFVLIYFLLIMYFARVLIPKKICSDFLGSCLYSNLQNVKNIFLIHECYASGTVEIVTFPVNKFIT